MNKPYVLVENLFEPTPELVASALRIRTSSIFNPDNLRSQGKFADPLLRQVATNMAREYGFPTLLRGVVLKSRAGCKRQPMHCDYNPNDEKSKLKAGLILAIEPGTKINISPTDELAIPPGAGFLFRGDTPHAGSAYEVDNVRVHFYIGAPPVNRSYPLEEFPKEPRPKRARK